MSTFASAPGAMWVLGSSVVARLPLTMLGIALLLHAEHLTGSFAAAGLVAAAYAVAAGAGGPLLGRVADRRGQTLVLVPSMGVTAALLAATALLPAGAPAALVAALAGGVGFACPPLAACVRALIPGLARDAERARVAYAVDASATELTWVVGPPLAVGVASLLSTGAALLAAAAILLAGSAAFAAQPASRRWRPPAGVCRPRGGSLRAPGMRTLVLALTAVGVLTGGVEVAIPAAADAAGSPGAAGLLIGVWGLGSLIGGVVATRRGGGARGARGLALILGCLAGGHLAATTAADSLVALGAALLVAGAALAPALASTYGMVERLAPDGTVTEAFAWLATAMCTGTAAGAAAAGALAEHAGPGAPFVLAGAAGLVAVLLVAARAATLCGACTGIVAPAAP